MIKISLNDIMFSRKCIVAKEGTVYLKLFKTQHPCAHIDTVKLYLDWLTDSDFIARHLILKYVNLIWFVRVTIHKALSMWARLGKTFSSRQACSLITWLSIMTSWAWCQGSTVGTTSYGIYHDCYVLSLSLRNCWGLWPGMCKISQPDGFHLSVRR